MIKMRYTISLMWLQVIHDHIQINKNKTKVKSREGPQDGIFRTGKLSSPCNKALFK